MTDWHRFGLLQLVMRWQWGKILWKHSPYIQVSDVLCYKPIPIIYRKKLPNTKEEFCDVFTWIIKKKLDAIAFIALSCVGCMQPPLNLSLYFTLHFSQTFHFSFHYSAHIIFSFYPRSSSSSFSICCSFQYFN